MGLIRRSVAGLVVAPQELWHCGAALLAGGALVASWNAFSTGGTLRDYLFFFWLPQLVLAALLTVVFRLRPATVAGTVLAMSAYLVAYIAWVRHIEDLSGLIWLGYFFSLPGGIVGALFARGFDRRLSHPGTAVVSGFALTLLGIAGNQAGLCAGFMSCRI